MFNKWLKRLKKNERGLTLVELLAVVVILAIVAAIAFIMIGNVIENSKKDAHIANAQQMISAAKLYEAGGEEIDDGVSAEELIEKEYLGPMTDPWDAEADYGTKDDVVKKSDDGEYTVSLSASKNSYDIENVSESDLNSKGRGIWEDQSSGGSSGGSDDDDDEG